MGFLVVTCIGPVSKFLGCIPLGLSMIIMAGLIFVCAGYSYLESQVFFKDANAFDLISNLGFAIIEGAVGLLVLVDFFVKKRCYTFILYLLTLALAGVALAYNIFKISIFNDKIDTYGVEHKLIQFMFLIRIGAEFVIQLVVSYIVYSYRKQL